MTVGNVDRPPPGQGIRGASGEAAERREQVSVVENGRRKKREKSDPALSLSQTQRAKKNNVIAPLLACPRRLSRRLSRALIVHDRSPSLS